MVCLEAKSECDEVAVGKDKIKNMLIRRADSIKRQVMVMDV